MHIHCYGRHGAVCQPQLLGRGLAQLPRDQIYVATKVGKYKAGEPEDFSGERVKRSVHESLERLGGLLVSLQHSAHNCTCKRMLWNRHAEGSVLHRLCPGAESANDGA